MPDHSPKKYQIKVQGHLKSKWSSWLDDMVVTLEDDGITLLSGPVIDDAALHGLLKKIRDLGLPLLSINYEFVGQENKPNEEDELDQNTE